MKMQASVSVLVQYTSYWQSEDIFGMWVHSEQLYKGVKAQVRIAFRLHWFRSWGTYKSPQEVQRMRVRARGRMKTFALTHLLL